MENYDNYKSTYNYQQSRDMNDPKILEFLHCAHEFQKANCIKDQCMSNVQYLYDFIKCNYLFNAKVKAVVVTGFDKELGRRKCVHGHLIVTVGADEDIIDPSYDVFSLDDKSYFHTIKDLKENTGFNYHPQFKKIIEHLVYFTKIADRMNNGEGFGADLKFCNDQADFIEKRMGLKRIKI